MSKIYCGNNAKNPKLVSGELSLGTRSKCLKKGIGKGKSMKPDPEYGGTYKPIDKRKMYCGDEMRKPKGYTYIGNLPMCLQKGIGLGKSMSSKFDDQFFKEPSHINVIAIGICITFVIALFVVLYFGKPGMVTDDENKKKIEWKKFITRYMMICIIFVFIVFIVVMIIKQ